MIKKFCKIAFALQLFVNVSMVNAMNNPNIETNDLKQSQSTNNKKVLQNNINPHFVEVSEAEQYDILMSLYRYPINKWKNIYRKYSFENDRIAFDKKYSSDECITENLPQENNNIKAK